MGITDSDLIHSKRSKDIERDCSNQERSDPSKKARTSGVNSTVSRSNSKYNKRNASSSSVPPGSEWSEHISSSGKKYYYNCVSEVSQWEQPREWAKRNSSKDSMYTSRTSKFFYHTYLKNVSLYQVKLKSYCLDIGYVLLKKIVFVRIAIFV